MNTKQCRANFRISQALLDALPEKCNSDKLDVTNLLKESSLEELGELIKDDVIWEIYVNKYEYGAFDPKTGKRVKNEETLVTVRLSKQVNADIRTLAAAPNMNATKVIIILMVLKSYESKEREALLRKMNGK